MAALRTASELQNKNASTRIASAAINFHAGPMNSLRSNGIHTCGIFITSMHTNL
jgi:hypothetical protein